LPSLYNSAFTQTVSNALLISANVTLATCFASNASNIPSDWKIAHVIPLFKNGDKSLPSNYRPISLLSCVSKVLEKIIFKHVLTPASYY
jgi:hypothetical protein